MNERISIWTFFYLNVCLSGCNLLLLFDFVWNWSDDKSNALLQSGESMVWVSFLWLFVRWTRVRMAFLYHHQTNNLVKSNWIRNCNEFSWKIKVKQNVAAIGRAYQTNDVKTVYSFHEIFFSLNSSCGPTLKNFVIYWNILTNVHWCTLNSMRIPVFFFLILFDFPKKLSTKIDFSTIYLKRSGILFWSIQNKILKSLHFNRNKLFVPVTKMIILVAN